MCWICTLRVHNLYVYIMYIYTHIFCRYRHVEYMNLIYLYTYITPISYIRVIKTNIIPGKVMCFDLSWGDCRRRLVCQTMGVFTRSFKWSWNHQKNTPSKTNGWNLKSGALGKRRNIHTNHQHCWVTCFFFRWCKETTKCLAAFQKECKVSKIRIASNGPRLKHTLKYLCFWIWLKVTLLEINISHLGKRKIIFKYALSGGYVNSLEGSLSLLFN